jgi:hypothetical protein
MESNCVVLILCTVIAIYLACKQSCKYECTPGFSGRICINVQYQRRERLHSREQDDFSGMFRLWGECKNTLWAAGKMFRYQQQDFLSLIMKFSDWKLK